MEKSFNALVHAGKQERFIDVLINEHWNVGIWPSDIAAFDTFNVFKPTIVFLESKHLNRATQKLFETGKYKFVVDIPGKSNFSKTEKEYCSRIANNSVFITTSLENERKENFPVLVCPHALNINDLQYSTPRPNPVFQDKKVYIGDYNPIYHNDYYFLGDDEVAIYGKGWRTPQCKGELTRKQIFEVLYNAEVLIDNVEESKDCTYLASALGCKIITKQMLVKNSVWQDTYSSRLFDILTSFPGKE